MLGGDRTSDVSPAETLHPLAELPESCLTFVRQELEELQQAGQLGPLELGWAIDQLVSGGVGLPDVLGIVFDFAELDWFAELTASLEPPAEDELLLALAQQLGLDPVSGKRIAPGPAGRLLDSCPPRLGLKRQDARAPGSEGVRQRPLRGWHG